MDKLWESVNVGAMTLPNRIVMAPMTRSRATAQGVPTPLNAEYYAQRASNGLIIAEGTQPSEAGQGYLFTPGIYTKEQIGGWRLVTDAVHAAGGRIFIQIMHVGRIAHPDNLPNKGTAVAPSAVRALGQMFTLQGMQDLPEPRELEIGEIATTIGDFRNAARCAIEAGADGVELHGANGYLIHQFLSENANHRTDAYGGSIENRVRFAVEVTAAVSAEIGPERTGIHISPANPFNDIVEGDTTALYKTLVPKLAALKLGYLHVVHAGDEDLLQWFRASWPTSLFVNRADRPRDQISRDVDAGLADVASIGRWILSNPDFVERVRHDLAFNSADPATFFGGDEHGYTDYPTIAEEAAQA
ncbi:MAG TPA: alkene reductase [Candidatus Acidoferrum sp.]|nr:alkene reductase [Candidatus Acidoferrum sp.]